MNKNAETSTTFLHFSIYQLRSLIEPLKGTKETAMKSTVTALYYGNPPPCERKPPVPAAETPLGQVKAAREALAATLTPAQKALLEAYDTAQDLWAEEEQRARFAEGFRMGVRLGAECFGE
jgi:hypothetical protein